MSKNVVVMMIALVGVSFGALLVEAENESSPLISVVGKDAFSDCGLSKLDRREQDRLLEFLSGTPTLSYLEESATRFMEKEGWERARILGLIRVEEAFEDFHVLVQYQGRIYHLDPSVIPHLPDPGLYWVDMIGSQWKVLYPDGSVGSFSAKEAD